MKPLSLTQQRFAGLACLAAAAFVGWSFVVGGQHYGEYPQPALHTVIVPVEELASQALYLAFGVPFVALLALGLWWTGVATASAAALRRQARNPRLPLLLALVVVGGSLAVRLLVLDRQVTTDDEEVYVFIARTLLEGRLVNPVPEDADFFANQYVVLNAHGWFGKYPVGHGLVLAVGLATGTLDAVVCLLGGLTAMLTFEVGRRALGRRRAALGVLLLALSPHFVWTHATLLSQTTSAFGLMLALAAWLRRVQGGRPGWVALSGLGMAIAIAARPAPGLLFAAALGAAVLWAVRARRATPRDVVVFAAMAALGVALVALTNFLQSGSPFRSGYHQLHEELGVGGKALGAVGFSVFGGLWRENFWLLGWPLSLLPLLFARAPRRAAWLLWSPVLAELVYRVVVPKTVNSTTGPTYIFEMVPVLCLLSADGLARLGIVTRRLLGRPGAVTAAVLAGFAASLVFFLPVEVRAVSAGAQQRRTAWTLLEAAGVTRALVFQDALVQPLSGKTWAFFPPSASPSRDDEVLFVRWPRWVPEAEQKAVALAFAQRRYLDRPVFFFRAGKEPKLVPLTGPTPSGGAPSGP